MTKAVIKRGVKVVFIGILKGVDEDRGVELVVGCREGQCAYVACLGRKMCKDWHFLCVGSFNFLFIYVITSQLQAICS